VGTSGQEGKKVQGKKKEVRAKSGKDFDAKEKKWPAAHLNGGEKQVKKSASIGEKKGEKGPGWLEVK